MSLSSEIKSPSATLELRYFTVAQANGALTYIRPVIADIRRTYRQAVALQQAIEQAEDQAQHDQLQKDYDQVVEQLNGYVDELQDVGVELKDFDMGLVDFPAMHGDQPIMLCWRDGEDAVTTWHDMDSGFAARKELSILSEPTGKINFESEE